MGEKEAQPEVEIRYALYNEDTGRYYGYAQVDSLWPTPSGVGRVEDAYKFLNAHAATDSTVARYPDHKVVAVEITHHPATTKPVLLTREEAAKTGTGVLRYVVQDLDGMFYAHGLFYSWLGKAQVFGNHAAAAVVASNVCADVRYVRLDTIPGHTEYKAYHLGPDYDRPIPAPTDEEGE